MSEKFSYYYCLEEKDISEAKKSSVARSTNRGKCKSCHNKKMNQHYKDKRQELLEKRFLNGIGNIELCKCGDYFYKISGYIKYNKCIDCTKRESDEKHKYNKHRI